MFDLVIDLDDVAARAGLKHLEAKGRDPSDLLEEIGSYAVSSTISRFERGVGPDGIAWTPSIRAREQGGQTLIDTGRLRASIAHRVEGDAAVIGTNLIYAAMQQFGGVIKALAAPFLRFRIGDRWISKRQIEIPARPFLGISDEDGREIGEITLGWLHEGFSQ